MVTYNLDDIQNILALGDSHGNTGFVAEAIGAALGYNCQVILQLGDFGIWDHRPAGVKFLDNVEEYLEQADMPLIFADGNHECVTKRSKAVTKRGFISVDDLTKDDKVLSVDDNGRRVWLDIQDVIVRHHHGDLISFRSRGIDFDATPGHRVVGRYKHGRKTWCENTAQNTANKHHDVIVSAINKLPDAPTSDDEIRLIAWCMTDSNPRDGGGWHFYQRESASYRIVELLERLGISHTTSVRHRNIETISGKEVLTSEPEVTIRIPKEEGKRKIPYDYNRLPPEALTWSRRQVEVFLEELVFTDGSNASSGTAKVIYCSRKKTREDIMLLLVANGYRTSSTEYRANHWRINIADRTSLDFDTRPGKSVQRTVTQTEEDVWCLKVSNGRFFIETEGKILLTGNCFDRLYDDNIYPVDEDGFRRVRPHIWHAPRGHIWSWSGVTFMAMGGAHSIDGPGGIWRQNRGPVAVSRIDDDPFDLGGWWPQETIKAHEAQEAIENALKWKEEMGPIDVLIAHDCPAGVPIPGINGYPAGDKNRHLLAQVCDAADPHYIFCGHFHLRHRGVYNNARVEILAADVNQKDQALAISVEQLKQAPPEVAERYSP